MENYLTETDWTKLFDDTVCKDSKIACLAARCLAIGLVCPSEKTAKSIVGLVVACEKATGYCVDLFLLVCAV